ncbi:hypothetical protein WME91_24010 [Sorangium sp. So ce269]
MDSYLKHCVVGSIILIVVAISSCERPSHLGGSCESTADCESDTQYAPGTECADGVCTCVQEGHTLCCEPEDTAPDCFLACRPCSECQEGWFSCAPGTAGTACDNDAKCAGPPDPRCGAGRCVDRVCQVDIYPGPLPSQVRGDCAQLECTQAGDVVVTADPADIYNDGNLCTSDVCSAENTPVNVPFDNGISLMALYAVDQICYESHPFDCIVEDDECGPSRICVPTVGAQHGGGFCAPSHCINLRRDTDEADVDCGGICRRPCEDGSRCAVSQDCISGVCLGSPKTCQSPTSADGVRNGSETGVDCGGPWSPCPPGQGCATGADCEAGVCWAAVCEEPSCIDGVRNGGELDADCGGPACPACPR